MVHEFGSFTVNEERREVLGPEGVRHVEPKVFDLIAFLIANRGRVVSKGELIAAVWDDRIISDAAIASAVNAARRALGDDGRRQTVIRTAHGRGFRFLAEPLSASRGTSDRPASGGIARIRLDEIVAADPRSQCGTHRMLTAGIAAELACFPGISVLRASPDGAGGVGGSIDIEAQEADFILTGTLMESTRRIRVSAQLIEHGGARQVWAENIDSENSDILESVDRLAKRVAATVVGRIEAAAQSLAVSRPSERLSVPERINRAQALYNQISPRAHDEVLELLAEVLSEEPENARALMLSGAIHDMAFFSGWTVDPDASLARAINFGRRAVQAAPTNAVAHAHLAEALLHAGQLTEAESHFRQALGLNPSNVVVLSLHASYLTHIGVYDCALAQLDRTRDLDPYGLNWIPWIRADVYFAMGDYSAVIATLEEIHIPFNNSRAVLAASYALVGRLEDARRTLLVFLTVAKAEMAFQPKSLDEWKVFLMRESSNARDKTIESLMAGLKLAGLEDVLLGDKNI